MRTPSAPRSRKVVDSEQRRPQTGAGNGPGNSSNGSSDLASVAAVIAQYSNKGSTGVGFGLIALGIFAVRLDRNLGYGLSIVGVIFVVLSTILATKSTTATKNEATVPQLPFKLLVGLITTVVCGALLLLLYYSGIINIPTKCSLHLPLEEYIKKCSPL
jgi:hypothetical protein